MLFLLLSAFCADWGLEPDASWLDAQRESIRPLRQPVPWTHNRGSREKKKKMESNSFLLTSISCSWIRTFLSLFPYVCMCFVTVYLVYVDCMLGTHPPRERESASSVENEIKVIDRLPVASLVDTTPPRPTSVSHLSLQYFLLMDWGDVGGMRFLVFYQLNDTFLFDFFSPLLFIHFTHFTQ